jgi:hypothetical protein
MNKLNNKTALAFSTRREDLVAPKPSFMPTQKNQLGEVKVKSNSGFISSKKLTKK